MQEVRETVGEVLPGIGSQLCYLLTVWPSVICHALLESSSLGVYGSAAGEKLHPEQGADRQWNAPSFGLHRASTLLSRDSGDSQFCSNGPALRDRSRMLWPPKQEKLFTFRTLSLKRCDMLRCSTHVAPCTHFSHFQYQLILRSHGKSCRC